VFKYIYGAETDIHIHRVKVDDKRTDILLKHEYDMERVLHQSDRVVKDQIDTWIDQIGVHVIIDIDTEEIHSVIRAA
jgi:hypothetical protein